MNIREAVTLFFAQRAILPSVSDSNDSTTVGNIRCFNVKEKRKEGEITDDKLDKLK
jgi:hypothetical protein